MKKRFTEEQILQIINEARQGQTVVSTCCKHGISEVTFYKWWNKFDGMAIDPFLPKSL